MNFIFTIILIAGLIGVFSVGIKKVFSAVVISVFGERDKGINYPFTP